MPNLIKKFKVEVGFYRGARKPPRPAQLKLKITPRKTGLKSLVPLEKKQFLRSVLVLNKEQGKEQNKDGLIFK